MSITISCPECGDDHHVNQRFAGRSVRCPSCEAVVEVPVQAEVIEVSPVDDHYGEVSHAEATELEAAEFEATEFEATEFEATGLETSELEPNGLKWSGSSPTAAGRVGAAPVETLAAPAVPSAAPVMALVPTGSVRVDHGSEDEDDEDDQVLGRGNRPEEEMDMTPMVDVTFLLLIFFMVTAAFSLQKSINMPRQQTDAPSTNSVEEDPDVLDVVDLEVDEFGSFLVLAPDWERETPGKQNLTSALREAIAGAKDGMRLSIKVHEAAKLRFLVDAMDAGTIAGFTELEVTQVEEFP